MKSFKTRIKREDWIVQFGNAGKNPDGSRSAAKCDLATKTITLRRGRRVHILSKDLAHEITHGTLWDELTERQVKRLEAAHARADKALLKFLTQHPELTR